MNLNPAFDALPRMSMQLWKLATLVAACTLILGCNGSRKSDSKVKTPDEEMKSVVDSGVSSVRNRRTATIHERNVESSDFKVEEFIASNGDQRVIISYRAGVKELHPPKVNWEEVHRRLVQNPQAGHPFRKVTYFNIVEDGHLLTTLEELVQIGDKSESTW